METVNTDKIQGRFKKGQSGNPAGKPKGARHKTTLAVQALLDGEAEIITRKAIELAAGGDITAIRLCLERIAPAQKDSSVQIDIPAIASVGDSSRALAVIIEAVSHGEITPSEGDALAGLIEKCRKLMETELLETRIAALEGKAYHVT